MGIRGSPYTYSVDFASFAQLLSCILLLNANYTILLCYSEALCKLVAAIAVESSQSSLHICRSIVNF